MRRVEHREELHRIESAVEALFRTPLELGDVFADPAALRKEDDGGGDVPPEN
jgi:hypothetical protein